ncbi:hypothetical protein [Massilia timonae]|uniref:hypothetical protein n=1 Tax=Massilia timonae TaxID=47229 RepID=UPI0028A7AD1B|nr:hypothetical protein [Massilia timonae]
MAFTRCPNPRELTVALLYQAMPPPVIDGIRKDPKPGGYADSGADIAHALRMAGVKVATPQASPDPARDLDWVFPDTPEGIAAARAAGATLLWANTVLFAGHPLEAVMERCWIVGQLPAAMQEADDKFATNARLRAAGLPVAAIDPGGAAGAAGRARAGVAHACGTGGAWTGFSAGGQAGARTRQPGRHPGRRPCGVHGDGGRAGRVRALRR